MTARAKELTPRATDLPAGQMRVFVDALGRLHYDVERLLTAAGVQRAGLNDPDAVIPCEALPALLGAALAQRHVADLGAQLAFQTPLGAFPLLDYLVLTTDTVGAALRQLQRFFHIASAPCRLEILEGRKVTRLVVQPGHDPFLAQYETALITHHLREETAQRVRISRISLMREPESRADLERLLGCPVQAPASWSGIEFPRESLAVSLRRRDPVLRRLLEDRAMRGGTRHRPGDDIVARVRGMLAAHLGREGRAMGDMARSLTMAPRTLQRRLADAGVSYKELVQSVRREVAETLLGDRTLAVSEVGHLLGFSEPSAFHRAFKRWVGVTPLEFRRSAGRSRAS